SSLAEAIECLESAKANDSIAYLRFFFQDPREDGNFETAAANNNNRNSNTAVGRAGGNTTRKEKSRGRSYRDAPNSTLFDTERTGSHKMNDDKDDMQDCMPGVPVPSQGPNSASSSRLPSIELEAVVSCTSDGLVVILRKARPPIPPAHPPLTAFDYRNGLFAAPWGEQPIRPLLPNESLYAFQSPLLPQYMPRRDNVKDAGGPPLDILMNSIRDVAVFAWGVSLHEMASINRKDYGPAPQIEDGDLIDPDDADLDDLDDPMAPEASSSRSPLRGNIGASSAAGPSGGGASGSNAFGRTISENYLTSRIPGEDRSAPTNTIDETVWATLRRDLLAVWAKMQEVLYPRYLFGGSMFDAEASGAGSGSGGGLAGLRGAYATLRNAGLAGTRDELAGLAGRVLDPESLLRHSNMTPGLRDWDLWGPLVFCLLLSMLLSFNAREKQRELVFSGVFAMVWIGEAVVTTQIKLLGGNISFAQSVCIIGYTLFPLVLAALLSALRLPTVARVPVYLLLVAWAMAAGVSILGGSGVVKNRVGIAVYPLFVFYLGLGCLCFIS
ncbi:hypothetical protein SEPCBS119000_003460, partial [Sporothrix epigloea]